MRILTKEIWACSKEFCGYFIVQLKVDLKPIYNLLQLLEHYSRLGRDFGN
jgi:hypothetical protein